MLYALSGTSGSGKTTIMREFLERNPSVKRLITYTTRIPRSDEIEGIDYHFIGDERFEELSAMKYFVYPIEYRTKYYAIAMNDLLSTREFDTISVLRPDSFPNLRQLVPIIGIYIFTSLNQGEKNPQDKLIYENAHLCDYQIENIIGNLTIAVDAVDEIIKKHSGG